jgi:hypothetical protein
MKQLYFILGLLTFLSAPGQTKKDTVDETEMAAINLLNEEYIDVSLIKLIATPEKYHGKRIQVKGYLKIQFEGNAIYLHKEDRVQGFSKNAFWVEFSDKLTKKIKPKNYSDQYVIILGTFNMNSLGHMGLFSGTFEDIIRLDVWSTRMPPEVAPSDSTIRIPR